MKFAYHILAVLWASLFVLVWWITSNGVQETMEAQREWFKVMGAVAMVFGVPWTYFGMYYFYMAGRHEGETK